MHRNKILILNLGSTSVKVSIYEMENTILGLKEHFSKKFSEIPSIKEFIFEIIKSQDELMAFVFRVVHGGKNYPQPILMSEDVMVGIRDAEKLAPIHNSILLNWYLEISEMKQKDIKCIACFDTSFYYELPQLSKVYAIKKEISEKYQIQKLGFHGFAHQSMLSKLKDYKDNGGKTKRVITLQLGGGSSITACLDGKPIDTSMGFSPLDGLIMGTRSGSIDPGIIIYLLKSGLTIDEIDTMLNFQSGIKGLTGTDNYQDLMLQNSKESLFAIDLYCRNIAKYLGSYITLLGGVEVIVFGGGIGENCHITREKVISYLQYLGIELRKDSNNNYENKEFKIISSKNSKADIYVIKPDEEYEMIKSIQEYFYNFKN